MIEISLKFANGKWYAEGNVHFPNSATPIYMGTRGRDTSHEAIQELAHDIIQECEVLIIDTNTWLRKLEGHHSVPQIEVLWSTTKIGGLKCRE